MSISETPRAGNFPPTPSTQDLDEIVRGPNGTHILFEMARDGVISPEDAVQALERFDNTIVQRLKRIWATFVHGLLRG
jgi:hypothetical protein